MSFSSRRLIGVRWVAKRGVASTAPPLASAHKSREPCANWRSARHLDPEELLYVLREEGLVRGLSKHWNQLEALHSTCRLTCSQIATVMVLCTGVTGQTEGGGKNTEEGIEMVSLGAKLVGLFSEFMIGRSSSLCGDEVVALTLALTSDRMPADKIWLKSLAERVPAIAEDLSPGQVVALAQSFVYLQFSIVNPLNALCGKATSSSALFSLPDLADLLLDCARSGFFSEQLCFVALAPFENAAVAAHAPAHAVCAALFAAALLDQKTFNVTACCERFARCPGDLRSIAASYKYAQGLAFAIALLPGRTLVTSVLPIFLAELCRAIPAWEVSQTFTVIMLGQVHRKITLLALTAIFDFHSLSPGGEQANWGSPWTIDRLADLTWTLDLLDHKYHPVQKLAQPFSSELHLEVCESLRGMDLHFFLEHRQYPFVLDISIFHRMSLEDGSGTVNL